MKCSVEVKKQDFIIFCPEFLEFKLISFLKSILNHRNHIFNVFSTFLGLKFVVQNFRAHLSCQHEINNNGCLLKQHCDNLLAYLIPSQLLKTT